MRTEMKCVLCGEFSSAQTCFRCESSPVFLHYCAAKLEADTLRDLLSKADNFLPIRYGKTSLGVGLKAQIAKALAQQQSSTFTS